MSRVKNFARSLVSGYLLIGINILYSLGSIPLALHYLSKAEFALWALITQIAGYSLILADLGMSGALSRILIDHKDKKNSSDYGSVMQTGVLVLFVQACLIVFFGIVISICLPQWMNISKEFWPDFRLLMILQCLTLAVSFIGRVFGFILQAHQRYDICNYVTMLGQGLNFFVLWFGFSAGWELYSLIVASGASTFFTVLISGVAVKRLKFLPQKGQWGKPSRRFFGELFFFGNDLFFLAIGQMLISASVLPVISRTMGVEAVTIWNVATKVFILAQQLVYRILDFSAAALSEMVARDESQRLQARFRDILILTGCAASGVVALALCNQGFLKIWTSGKIFWDPINDALMAVSFFVYTLTRVPAAFVTLTKEVRALKFIYLAEGVAFVAVGLWLAKRFGFPGIIWAGILTNLLFSGIYGIYRLTKYFQIRPQILFGDWLGRPIRLFLTAGAVAIFFWLGAEALIPKWQWRFVIHVTFFGIVFAFLFWRVGLPPHLRTEFMVRGGSRWLGKLPLPILGKNG